MRYSILLRIFLAVALAGFLVLLIFSTGKKEQTVVDTTKDDRFGQDKENIGNIGESVEVVNYIGEEKDSLIKAGRMLGFKGGRQIFRDFTFTDFKDGSPGMTISGRKAHIGKGEEEASSILAEGKVHIETPDGFFVKADHLSYSKNTKTNERRVISRGEVAFSKGEISGKGMDLHYDLDKGLLQLHKEVKIKILPEGEEDASPVYIIADLMEFNREAHYLDFMGNAGIYQKDNYLKCGKIRGSLTGDNKHFTSFSAESNVNIFFAAEEDKQPSAGTEGEGPLFLRQKVSKRLRTDRLWLDFAEDGVTFDEARLTGNVQFEMIPPDNRDAIKTLRCDAATLFFFENESRVKELDARGHVRVTVSPRDEGGHIMHEEVQEVRTGLLRALFDPDSGEVSDVFLEEDVVFYFGEIQSVSKSGYYNLAENTLKLKGRPRVTDGKNRISAREIVLEEEKNLLRATGRVRAITVPEEDGNQSEGLLGATDDPILFLADTMVMNYQDRHVVFEDNVKVSRGDSEIYARSVELDGQTDSMTASGDVKSIFRPPERNISKQAGLLNSREAIYFWADTMSIDQTRDTITFKNNVRILQGENTITTEEMIVFNRDKRFIARGDVKTVYYLKDHEGEETDGGGNTIFTTAGMMAYDESDDKIVYLQDVVIKEGTDNLLQGNQVEMYFSGMQGDIKKVVLKGDVIFRRGHEEGSGDEAEYFPEVGKIILYGKEAKFERGGRLTSMGNILTFFYESDKIIAESLEDGRLKTLYSPGRDKHTKDVDADADH